MLYLALKPPTSDFYTPSDGCVLVHWKAENIVSAKSSHMFVPESYTSQALWETPEAAKKLVNARFCTQCKRNSVNVARITPHEDREAFGIGSRA